MELGNIRRSKSTKRRLLNSSGVAGISRPPTLAQPYTVATPYLWRPTAVNPASIVATFSVGPVQEVIIPTCETALSGFDLVPHPPKGTKVSDALIAEAEQGLLEADKVIKSLEKMRWAWYDTIGFRKSLFQYSLKTDGQWNMPEEFIRLPADSFGKPPTGVYGNDEYSFDPLLKGIVYKKADKSTHYYQTQTRYGEPVEINPENVLIISEETPGNLSIMASMLPYVDEWRMTRRSLDLAIHRVGVPNAATEVDRALLDEEWEGEKAMGIPKELWDYLDKIIKAQSSGTAFNMPPGTKLRYPPISMAMNPMEADSYLKRDILQHILPVHILDTVGQAISKTSQPVLDLFLLLTKNRRELCAKPFEDWYSWWLSDQNGFKAWTATVEWWPIGQKDINAEHDSVRKDHAEGLLGINEARVRQGYPELPRRADATPDYKGLTIEDVIEEYQKLHGKTTQASAA